MLRSPTAALAVLTLVNLLNYMDRYTLAAIQPRVKEALRLSDFELGLLSSSFVVVYMLASPFFGRLGDTRSRTRLISLGVGLWSFATAGAGLARNFAQMFASRAAVGVGEAAYGTIAPSMLADLYPKERRGRVFAVFFTAIFVGSALAYTIVGGQIEPRWGWRAAFFAAGLPGILLAGVALLLRDPPRGAHDADEPPGRGAGGRGSAIDAYLALLRIRPYVVTVLGYAAYTFAVGGFAVWMPTFLERVRGIPLAEANDAFGKITVVAGLLGTLAGGWAGDRLLARGRRGAYLLVSGTATLVAVPVTAAALLAPDRETILAATFGALFLLSISNGPINTAIVNYVPPDMRASAVALSIFTIHAFGDAISPSIIGAVSDATSLAVAAMIVPAAVGVSGAIWTWGAFRGTAPGGAS